MEYYILDNSNPMESKLVEPTLTNSEKHEIDSIKLEIR